MPRRIRDLAITVAVLLVLFLMLIAIDTRVREGVGRLSADVASQDWNASGGAFITGSAQTIYALVSTYTSDNTYLVAFLVAAIVLFVLMLRT